MKNQLQEITRLSIKAKEQEGEGYHAITEHMDEYNRIRKLAEDADNRMVVYFIGACLAVIALIIVLAKVIFNLL